MDQPLSFMSTLRGADHRDRVTSLIGPPPHARMGTCVLLLRSDFLLSSRAAQQVWPRSSCGDHSLPSDPTEQETGWSPSTLLPRVQLYLLPGVGLPTLS